MFKCDLFKRLHKVGANNSKHSMKYSKCYSWIFYLLARAPARPPTQTHLHLDPFACREPIFYYTFPWIGRTITKLKCFFLLLNLIFVWPQSVIRWSWWFDSAAFCWSSGSLRQQQNPTPEYIVVTGRQKTRDGWVFRNKSTRVNTDLFWGAQYTHELIRYWIFG